MRILICTPYGIDEPRGNSVAARRLRDGFRGRGHDVLIVDRCADSDEGPVREAAWFFDPQAGLVMHGWRCAVSFRAVKSATDAPLIVSLRGTDLNEMIEDREMGPAIREVLSWCDGIAVFSRGALQRLAREGHVLAGKSRIIPNGVSLPGNGEVGRFSRAVPCDGIVFVGVGGIREVKGLSWLAENLSALRKSGLDIHYVHAGPVLEKEEGARFLRICREEPWIHYAGEVPHEQVFSFLRLGDVFVSASRSEGMPHAVREAMLAGLPCLLSDIEGHRALARSGREAIFFGDAADFAAKATTLAGDSGLRERLKKGAKERVERMCLNGKEIDAYLHFFSDLVKKHGNRPFSLPGRRTTADRFRR